MLILIQKLICIRWETMEYCGGQKQNFSSLLSIHPLEIIPAQDH